MGKNRRRGRMEPTLDNILKASMAMRVHARRQNEGYCSEHNSALSRFDENELILRIRSERHGKAEEPR